MLSSRSASVGAGGTALDGGLQRPDLIRPVSAFLLMSALLALAAPPAAFASTPPVEVAALGDLYYATGGNETWNRTDGWLTLDQSSETPSDPCDDEWYGVTCDTADQGGGQRVVGLNLSQWDGQIGNGLDGSLPESIGDLTHLTALRLGTSYDLSSYGYPTNHLAGTTPSTICQMAALEDIYFRYVWDLEGIVPTCMGSLSNLTSIDYSYAGTLSGTLPRGLCDLTRLEKLQFQFTGGLSGTSSVEHLYF